MERNVGICFIVKLLLGLLMSMMIMCVPLVQIKGTPEQRMLAYIVAAIFWLSIIGQLITSIVCKKILMKREPKKFLFRRVYNGHMSVFRFFSNKEALIVDIGFIGCAILVVVTILFEITNKWLVITFVASLVLFFNLHCILNGKNYECIKLLQIYKKEHKENE